MCIRSCDYVWPFGGMKHHQHLGSELVSNQDIGFKHQMILKFKPLCGWSQCLIGSGMLSRTLGSSLLFLFFSGTSKCNLHLSPLIFLYQEITDFARLIELSCLSVKSPIKCYKVILSPVAYHILCHSSFFLFFLCFIFKQRS